MNLRRFRGRREKDAELAEEIRSHLAHDEDLRTARGVDAEEARRQARVKFGPQNTVREAEWRYRSLPWLENLWRDLKFSVRLLRQSRGFTLVALLTLMLGVGANTAVFSLINGLLLRPLAVPDADQLAVLSMEHGGEQGGPQGQNGGPEADYSFSTPYFRSLEGRRDIFANVFAYNADTFQVRGKSGNESFRGMVVSGQYFEALEIQPLLGRYLTPEDDRHGGSPAGLAVVISEHFWNSWFGRAPDVVGRKLMIANNPFTVVGVMPKGFIGASPTYRPEIFAPLSADPILDAPRDHINAGLHAWWLTVMARMQPGASLEHMRAALLTISNPILHEASTDPAYLADEEKHHFRFSAEPGSRGFTFARVLFRKPLVTMFAMCVGILLLACMNLASLLMARSFSRERELATRLALGASRRRLIQQLLIESLLIATAGTVLGLVTSPLVSHSLAAMLMSGNVQQAMTLDTSFDVRVYLFAAAIAMLATVVIGLVPALQATSGELSAHIKNGQHATKANERRRLLPRVLMTVEVALALLLVSGAGLLAMSLVKLYRSGMGFEPRGIVNIAFSMDKQPLEGDALMRTYRQLGEGLSQQPGVKDVSFEFIVPLSRRGWNGSYSAQSGRPHLLFMNSVAPNYFNTMRIPMSAGRDFTWRDTKQSGMKMILNQSAAKMLFPNEPAPGQRVVNTLDHITYEVVAVVGDTKYRDMRRPAPAAAYVPIMQDPQEKPSLSAVLRVDGPQTQLAAAARALTARLAPGIPAPTLTTMDEVVDDSMGAERMMAVLAVFFAGCALLVTGIGLYGTLAYSTSRRTSEIGVRMALGAQRGQVMAMVFRQNVVLAIAGSSAGVLAAMLASRALASFLYETSPHDPWILIGSVAVITGIASGASLLPAMRAARIEPMTAIRCE